MLYVRKRQITIYYATIRGRFGKKLNVMKTNEEENNQFFLKRAWKLYRQNCLKFQVIENQTATTWNAVFCLFCFEAPNKNSEGVWLLTFGQQFSEWCQICPQLSAGTQPGSQQDLFYQEKEKRAFPIHPKLTLFTSQGHQINYRYKISICLPLDLQRYCHWH